MFKNSAMKGVSPKKNGTVRENSLYHFIMDHMECELLSPYQTHCGKGERQVIYVEFPVENALINVLFPGFKLVGQHLSVDKHVIHEESPLSKNFSPAHCTLECDNEDASQRLVAHVYFNRYGQFSHCQAKVYSLARGIKGTEDGHLRVMSDKEKELILDHARPFQELFDKLLNQKAKIFIELYQASFHLDEELSQAIKEQNVPEAIQKADELMELTLKLTRYNDVEKDGRVAWLKHMLTQLKEGDLFICNTNAYNKITDIQRWDIIAYNHDFGPDLKTALVAKRVVGLPGDKLDFEGNAILLNGSPIKLPDGIVLNYKNFTHQIFKYLSLTVPEDCVFTIGDNSIISMDSRYYGPINFKDILGKVILISQKTKTPLSTGVAKQQR